MLIVIIKSFIPSGLFETKQSGEISGKYYNRKGSCNTCGRCCTNIYLVHNKKTIESLEVFEKLQAHNAEYEFFTPLDSTDHGLQFQCVHLSPENQCTIYEKRPSFCRKYPSEKGMLLGGELAEDCGYWFEPIKTFSEVLNKTSKKESKKKFQHVGKLLS